MKRVERLEDLLLSLSSINGSYQSSYWQISTKRLLHVLQCLSPCCVCSLCVLSILYAWGWKSCFGTKEEKEWMKTGMNFGPFPRFADPAFKYAQCTHHYEPTTEACTKTFFFNFWTRFVFVMKDITFIVRAFRE